MDQTAQLVPIRGYLDSIQRVTTIAKASYLTVVSRTTADCLIVSLVPRLC